MADFTLPFVYLIRVSGTPPDASYHTLSPALPVPLATTDGEGDTSFEVGDTITVTLPPLLGGGTVPVEMIAGTSASDGWIGLAPAGGIFFSPRTAVTPSTRSFLPRLIRFPSAF